MNIMKIKRALEAARHELTCVNGLDCSENSLILCIVDTTVVCKQVDEALDMIEEEEALELKVADLVPEYLKLINTLIVYVRENHHCLKADDMNACTFLINEHFKGAR